MGREKNGREKIEGEFMKEFFANLSTNKKLALAAFIFGVIALFAGNPYDRSFFKVNEKQLALSTVNNSDKISVIDLADWIIQSKADFELVDLRSQEKYNEYSIPNAQCIPLAQLPSSDLLRNQKIIFYSDDDVAASQAWFMFKSKGYKAVYILHGGLNAWKEKVLFPKAPVNASKDELAQFEKMKEVSKYFGGQAQTDSLAADSKPSFQLPTSTAGVQKIGNASSKKKKREGC
jgi:rhodanese-related sulfurtransferase